MYFYFESCLDLQNRCIMIKTILEKYPCDNNCKFKQGRSSVTLAYYVPIYDKTGVNTNPDRNTTTTDFSCVECDKKFIVRTRYGTDPEINLINF